MKIRVNSEQNIIDFTVQELGSASGLFDIIAINDGFSVDTILTTGQMVEVPEEIVDINVNNVYKKNNVIVVTGEELIEGDFNNDFNNDFDI